jgi:hypothetical protein
MAIFFTYIVNYLSLSLCITVYLVLFSFISALLHYKILQRINSLQVVERKWYELESMSARRVGIRKGNE